MIGVLFKKMLLLDQGLAIGLCVAALNLIAAAILVHLAVHFKVDISTLLVVRTF